MSAKADISKRSVETEYDRDYVTTADEVGPIHSCYKHSC